MATDTTDRQFKVRIWAGEGAQRRLCGRVVLLAPNEAAAIAEVKRTQPKRKEPRFFTCKEAV